jgi:chorismate dehydratase
LTSFVVLPTLRVGCVQYLNARPLICDYPGKIVLAHPSELAGKIREGAVDVALVPAFEALNRPGWPIADNIAIAGWGSVYSVYLAGRVPINRITRVVMDPASLTSVNLVRCILEESYGIKPEYLSAPEREDDARLLIGNHAIDFREREGDRWIYYDLGEEWRKFTGLPFVFAVWLMGLAVKDPSLVADELRFLKNSGLSRIDRICGELEPCRRRFCREYLTRYIRFDLGENEKKGLDRFRKLLVQRGQLAASSAPLRFV